MSKDFPDSDMLIKEILGNTELRAASRSLLARKLYWHEQSLFLLIQMAAAEARTRSLVETSQLLDAWRAGEPKHRH
jgi:hypothetical protein